MKRLLQFTLVLLITTGLTTIANAQITAKANVQASIDVTEVQGLNFGDLTPGASSDVQTSSGDAGQFTVSGNSGNVSLKFAFDNGGVLQGPDGATMDITFDGSDAAWGEDSNTQTESWDPTSEKNGVNVAGASNQEIYVFIGGSITAANDQVAGEYTETITLTATHN